MTHQTRLSSLLGALLLALPLASIAGPAAVGAGRIERLEVPGTEAVPGRTVEVWLPPG